MLSHFTRPLLKATRNNAAALRRTFVYRTTAVHFSAAAADLPYHLVVGLPALSPTMEAGALAEWYLKEGDSFSAGDGLAKIETDKAAMDFEAQDDGFVAKILVAAGEGNDIPCGTPIMITVEEEADVAAFSNYTSPAVAAAAAAEKPVVVEAPKVQAAPVAAAAVAAPPPPPAALAAAPAAPPVAATPAPASVPAAAGNFSTAWGLGVVDSSPLAKMLAMEQNDYVSKYGTTGQAPILPADIAA